MSGHCFVTKNKNHVMKYPSPKMFFITDQYIKQSIKSFDREKRAITGVIRVAASRRDQPRPKQLKKYLSHGPNKIEFVQFLLKDWKVQLLRHHNFLARNWRLNWRFVTKNKNLCYCNFLCLNFPAPIFS